MDPLRFRVTSAQLADSAYVLTLGGEIDLANVEQIDRELNVVVDDGARRVVIDLLDVPFVESTVLGVLLRHARRLRARGGDLTVVTDDVRVLRVFEISGLDAYFRLERTLVDAVESAIAGAAR